HPLLLSPRFLLHPPPPTTPYTLSLHDALPISLDVDPQSSGTRHRLVPDFLRAVDSRIAGPLHEHHRLEPGVAMRGIHPAQQRLRSEEHTSELQSRENLVCRLLLEKKKKITQAD